MTTRTTSSSEGTAERHQARVDQLFTTRSQEWRELYEKQDVFAVIHQERQAWALKEIDGLSLPSGTHVLEVGCGAGLTSAALAQRGLRVTAIDNAAEMVKLTNELVQDRNLDDLVSASVADAHELPFADESFAVVIALGVLTWLHAPERALAEMARLAEPGGYVLMNMDNLLRLHFLLDPRLNPAAGVLRRFLRPTLVRMGLRRPQGGPLFHLRAIWSFDASLARVGLERVVGITHGFGPFTFMGRPVFSDAEGVRLHHLLQTAADDGHPLLRGLGAQYFVLARKPMSTHPESLRETPAA